MVLSKLGKHWGDGKIKLKGSNQARLGNKELCFHSRFSFLVRGRVIKNSAFVSQLEAASFSTEEGCAELKAMLQWLAASEGQRRLLYFPFELKVGPVPLAEA